MRGVFHIFEFWVLAFVSLSATLVLLNIFWDLIDQNLCLKGLREEAVIAGIASLIEAVGLWLLVSFAPAVQAMIIPGLIVGLIYKITHFEDWGWAEIVCLLLFQLAIALIGASLLAANFGMAIIILLIFSAALAFIAGFMRGL